MNNVHLVSNSFPSCCDNHSVIGPLCTVGADLITGGLVHIAYTAGDDAYYLFLLLGEDLPLEQVFLTWGSWTLLGDP